MLQMSGWADKQRKSKFVPVPYRETRREDV